jgi:hypothetical protein
VDGLGVTNRKLPGSDGVDSTDIVTFVIIPATDDAKVQIFYIRINQEIVIFYRFYRIVSLSIIAVVSIRLQEQ